jgi:uncharacterized protein (TIGR03435 family)
MPSVPARLRFWIISGLCFCLSPLLPAQDQPPAPHFDVASIKPNLSGLRTLQKLEFAAGGRFTAINATLVDMIVQAYPTRRIQMQGGPGWIDSDRFDVMAETDPAAGEVKTPQMRLMLRTLLEQRFALKFHTESKEMPVLALVPAKTGAKLVECKDDEKTSLTPGDRGQLVFRRMPMVGLVNTMANILHTPVVDGTGITGFYDFTLDPDRFAGQDAAADPSRKESFADLVVVAVREQLGLRLEKQRATLEITFIDQAEPPTPN